MSFETFGEPVMFVRSPITAKPNSGVIFSDSSPDNSKAFASDAIFFLNRVPRGGPPAVQFAWLGVTDATRDCPDVFRGRPAAAAHNIQPAVCHPRCKFGCK